MMFASEKIQLLLDTLCVKTRDLPSACAAPSADSVFTKQYHGIR
jgi:hypothetical protein